MKSCALGASCHLARRRTICPLEAGMAQHPQPHSQPQSQPQTHPQPQPLPIPIPISILIPIPIFFPIPIPNVISILKLVSIPNPRAQQPLAKSLGPLSLTISA